MNVFAVLLPTDPSPVVDTIKAKFPDDHLRVSPTQWLVASPDTTPEVSAQLEIYDIRNPSGPKAPAIVLAVSNYFGIAPLEIWEWLQSRMEGRRG